LGRGRPKMEIRVPFCRSERVESEYVFYLEFRASVRKISCFLGYYRLPRKIRNISRTEALNDKKYIYSESAR